MHFKLRLRDDQESRPQAELWIDQIVEYYAIGSSYYGTLSVLFDAIMAHVHATGFNMDVNLTIDEEGFCFIMQASDKDQETFIQSIRSNKGLIRLLKRLSNGFEFSSGDFSFRIFSEGMSIMKMKSRQSMLSDYLRGELTSKLYHD